MSMSRGVALFDAGRYWDAHEAWEASWRAAVGPEKALLQSLILWAAALHQHRQGLTHGARRLLRRALDRLDQTGDATFEFEPDQLRDALVDSWAQLERGNVVQVVRLGALRRVPQPAEVQLEHRKACPYCGELVLVSVEAELSSGADYVEDCPVCCRPWEVHVRGGDQVSVELARSDD